MKPFCLSLLLTLCFQLNAQNKEITISGQVLGSKYKKTIPYAPVRLICSDSSILQTYTDSAGNYSLKKSIHKSTVAILEVYPPEKKLYGLCPFSFKNALLYFPEKIKLFLSIDSLHNDLIKNIDLTEGNIDYDLPHVVYFKTNSLDFSVEQENYYATDTAMDCVVDYMRTHPKYFLTVMGYADKNEKNKQELSEQRAKLIYELLIKEGLENKRICYVGNGDKVPAKQEEYGSERMVIQTNSKIEIQISLTNYPKPQNSNAMSFS
jgi:hypothetical protein